ncbi:MAG: signal peptidase I [Peptococcia bacterium]|jgi:signal peptidase
MLIKREPRRQLARCLLVMLFVIVILFLTNTNLFTFTNKSNFIYGGRPLLWLGVAWLVYLFPRTRFAGRLSLRRFIAQLAVGAAVIYLLFLMTAGMTQGFGKSPYAFTPFAILLNLFYVVSFTVGVEAARSYLINSYKGKRVVLILGLVSVFFVLTELSWREIQNIQTNFAAVKYVGGTLCPALAQSVFTSYFAYLGGLVPTLIYHGILVAFEWFCPILPDLSWSMKTFLGCFVPVFSLLFVQHLYLLQARELKRTSTGSEQISGWLFTSIFSVLIIWFAVGLFPVYPSVIVTGSMEPLIKPGDIVLLQKIQGEEAQIGDIIQYFHQEEEIYITHRVIAIDNEAKKKLQTQGDNNPSPDSFPVFLEQVKGKVRGIIPKVGWLTLVLRSKGGIPADVGI